MKVLLLQHINFESLDHTCEHFFLDRAVDFCHASIVKLVLEMGYVRWAHDESDKKSLGRAATKGIQLLQLVFNAAPDSLLSDHDTQISVLEAAIQSKNFTVVEFLKNKGFDRVLLQAFEDNGENGLLLRYACCRLAHVAGESRELALLLLGWIDVGAVLAVNSHEVEHLIRGLAAGDFQSLLSASLDYYLEIHSNGPAYQRLLDLGLSYVAYFGRRDTASLLLDRGANPNGSELNAGESFPRMTNRDCALSYAVNGHGDIETINLLLDWGVHPSMKYFSLFCQVIRHSPLEKRPEILRLLTRRVPLRLTIGDDHFEISLLAAQSGKAKLSLIFDYFNFKPDPKNFDHQEAFINVGKRGHIAMLKKFLDAGFDANLESFYRRPLNILLATACAPDPKDAQTGVRLLLQYGANILRQDSTLNRTLLQNLVSRDLKVLSDEGPGIRILSQNGADLLDIETFQKDDELCIDSPRSEASKVQSFRTDLLYIAASRDWTENDTAASTVNILLKCYEERGIPLSQIKDRIVAATVGNSDREITRIMWKYYWRRVYPVD